MDRSYEEALLYLHQVKTEFSARPHIYNELLYILKTFNSQQIDVPGVIRRVSKLLQSDKTLLLGFNTFLPEGYKIELPLDNDGPPPFAVYQVPGQPGVTPIIRCHAPPAPAPAAAAAARPPQASTAAMRPPPREQPSGGGPPQGPQIPPHSSQPSFGHKPLPSAATLAGNRGSPVPPSPWNGHPIVALTTLATMNRSDEEALLYMEQVKIEFGDRPHIYIELFDILNTFKS